MKRCAFLLFALLAASALGQDWTWKEIGIPVRDTNSLAADRWTSETPATPKPVILIQTPYNKNKYRLGQFTGYTGPSFPRSTNYHVVVVDWRGFYGSTNAAKPGYNRGLDGYDSVQWLATQTWCNGQVATWGSSALGLIQYQTAAEHPPNLVSCVIQVKDFQNRYENYFYGGVYRQEHVTNLERLGLVSTNLILAHPTYDIAWQLAESATDLAEDIAVPVLVVGGWFDHFPETVLRSYRDLRERSDPAVRDRHRLIFGPWLHGETGLPEQGDWTFLNATNLGADTVDFWDFTVRGVTNQWAGRPAVTFYQMGENIWIPWTSWTGGTRTATQLYLQPDGSLASTVWTGTADTAYAYDPADPTPALGGTRFNPFDPTVEIGPIDIAPEIESRDDVRVFSTPALDAPLRLNGPLSVVLHVSSDRTDTDFAVRLTDVDPEGHSFILTQGIRRGRFRNGYTAEELMVSGQVYELEIPLAGLGMTFQPGHRLRLVISSACAPHFHANRNDGGPMYGDGPRFVATNRIHVGASTLSRLEFHTLPDDLDLDGMDDVWEAAFFGALDRDGAGDADGDGFLDAHEFLAGTSPTNTASLLRLDITGEALAWPSASNRIYCVQHTPTLEGPWTNSITDLPAEPPTNHWIAPVPDGFWRIVLPGNPH